MLRETAYADPWDLVTELAAAHYGGAEDYPPDSDEVRLLLRTLALLLREELAGVSDGVLLESANRLLGRPADDGLTAALLKRRAALFGGVTPAERLTAALLSPLLYEFASDGDGVPDNDGALPGTGAADRAGNLLAAFTAAARRMLLYVRMIWETLLRR